MSNHAFEQKNSDDFEANTSVIEKALQEIESNRKLKPTIAQLSLMTGIHRNTISNRVFPLQRLRQIKEARKNEKMSMEDKDSASEINPIKFLKNKISNLQIEAIYWFNKYHDLKLSNDNLKQQYKQLKDSQQYYKNLWESKDDTLTTENQEVHEDMQEPLSFQPTETKQ